MYIYMLYIIIYLITLISLDVFILWVTWVHVGIAYFFADCMLLRADDQADQDVLALP